MLGLKGKRAIVTGGAWGIGQAISLRLAREGVAVGILDLDQAKADEISTQITTDGGQATSEHCDISDYDRIKEAVLKIEERNGATDILVNNAGWDKAMKFLDSNPEFWRKVININYYGLLNMSYIVAKGMVERGGGRIINISSDAGRVGSSGCLLYTSPSPRD